MSQPWSGVFAATLTPYDGAGRVDAGVVRTLTRYLINSGLAGAAPCGTTGEFPLLTRDEKAAVNRGAGEAAGDEGRIVAGVWAATATDRAWLAREAETHGAAAVFLTTPTYYPAAASAILEWYRGARAATRLPLFAYNIPQYAANEIPLEVLDRLAGEGVIQGYKDSSPDPERLRAVVRLLKGRIAVLGGNESLFVEARDLGVDGFISGVAGVFPRTVLGVWRGEEAAVRRLSRIKDAVKRGGGVPALKFLSRLRGFAVGEAREPIPPVPAEVRAELEALHAEAGDPA